MEKLSVYSDKEGKNFVMSHDLDIIDLYAPDIIKNKYYKNNILYGEEMIEYGEFILNIVENYTIVDFKIETFDLFKLFFFLKPYNFNIELVSIYISQKNYKLLESYINNFIELFKDDNIKIYFLYDEINHKYFFDFLNEFSNKLKKYFEDNLYYNSEIDHTINKKNLDEIKSFGYFNLKFGEYGYIGIWSIEEI